MTPHPLSGFCSLSYHSETMQSRESNPPDSARHHVLPDMCLLAPRTPTALQEARAGVEPASHGLQPCVRSTGPTGLKDAPGGLEPPTFTV